MSQASRSDATSTATLPLLANAIMTAWELGDTETYRAHCAPGVRMTIPRYGLDVTGFDVIWGVRTSMKPLDAGPLDLHTVVSHAVNGRSVDALAQVFSRSTGQVTQHARVRFDFDDEGRLVHYHQDVIWPAG
jgi:hypothetical protein